MNSRSCFYSSQAFCMAATIFGPAHECLTKIFGIVYLMHGKKRTIVCVVSRLFDGNVEVCADGCAHWMRSASV
jgi:hypothetical protein